MFTSPRLARVFKIKGLKSIDTNPFLWYNPLVVTLGYSQAVRHQTLTLAPRWFESIYPSQKKALAQASAFFSYIRLRRVLLLRSDIRLTPSGIRFASFGGEYNITEVVRLQYHCRLRQYHADEVGISLKTFPTSPKPWTNSNRHTVGDDLPGVPNKFVQTGRRGRRPLQFKNYLQSHRCNGVLDRFGLTKHLKCLQNCGIIQS